MNFFLKRQYPFVFASCVILIINFLTLDYEILSRPAVSIIFLLNAFTKCTIH